MAKLSLSIKNAMRPAPRWFRIAKKVIYALQAGGMLTGTLTRLGISDADQLFIAGWVTFGMETLSLVFANGEDYISTTQDANTGNQN